MEKEAFTTHKQPITAKKPLLCHQKILFGKGVEKILASEKKSLA
jgi:hypothetical protein